MSRLGGVGCSFVFVASAISGLLLGSAAFADDKQTERERKVKVAMAIAEAEVKVKAMAATSPPELAPQPRPALMGYAEGARKAKADQVPIVVYVGWDGPRLEGVAAIRVESYTAERAGPMASPGVVVGYPAGAILQEEARLEGKPSAATIEKAADAARRKMDAKPMPGKTAMPTTPSSDYFINADVKPDCICGDGCKCKPDSCPGTCPVQAVQFRRECGPNGCRVTQATNGFTVVPTPKAPALPDGYRWVLTPQGYGLADPWNEWNNAPCASNTDRLNSGYYYTPIPGRDPSPRGYWVSPCTKDADCRVVACDVPAIGQHGQPTAANAQAVATTRDTFNPNDYVGGYRRVLKPACEGGNCPLPATPAPAQVMAPTEPARVIVGYTQQRVCQGNGTCRIVNVPIYR